MLRWIRVGFGKDILRKGEDEEEGDGRLERKGSRLRITRVPGAGDEDVARNLWGRQVLAIVLWYITNGSTVMLNRYLFMTDVGFTFPMTLTLMHLVSGYALSTVALKYFLRDLDPIPLNKAQYTSDKLKFATLFVGNIILGNVALKFIPVSFMQTIKSMTPFFTTLFQYLITGTRYTNQTLLSLFPVVGGVILATLKEQSFNMVGFLAAMAGCLVQATQIVYASKLLNEGKMDVFNTVRFVCPPAVIGLAPLIITWESAALISWITTQGNNQKPFALLMVSCFLAFLLNLSTFSLLKVVSGVAYSVSGNFKVVFVIIISILLFKNPVTPLGMSGCAITIAGCTWYGLIKNRTIEPNSRTIPDVLETVVVENTNELGSEELRTSKA
mmetsp:Transcript_9925/g.20166  ORF Transcript_9925/g.20166 Transcript_9925/m.20166 type:complete len:385 (-) Transcript_9925:1264-2418(-)|eukprot:CAMPEP_0184678548 /NCGR_PEP_ID=MMETSP0312-20130426/1297_1 /TAXON_ID=31354 /ORGANISM="Compsopogon coeruleus, Strain SAG 36.94" /LENGTH=384 /DNA_ID=CAMNT_0027127367 /DNA_START=21 /DNA_END=1175 /DNA_ORIENTATION=+